jgi:hypothetical protein
MRCCIVLRLREASHAFQCGGCVLVRLMVRLAFNGSRGSPLSIAFSSRLLRVGLVDHGRPLDSLLICFADGALGGQPQAMGALSIDVAKRLKDLLEELIAMPPPLPGSPQVGMMMDMVMKRKEREEEGDRRAHGIVIAVEDENEAVKRVHHGRC